MRTARLGWWVAVALVVGAPAAWAQGRLDRVAVDRVRIGGGGRVQVWLTPQDPDGSPIARLRRDDFSAAWDGRTPTGLEVEAVDERDPVLRLAVLVDPDLARSERSSLRAALGALAERAGDKDQVLLRETGAGKRVRGPLRRADDLLERLDAGGGAASPLYDALFEEVRALARLSRGQCGAVLLITSGVETGSRHKLPEILALSGAYDQHVPVLVLMVDPRGNGSEGERLSRFAPRTGGSFDRLESADRLAGGARRALERLRGAYVLTFRDPRWDGSVERHTLEVEVTAGSDRRTGATTVVTDDVMARAWWQGALPWVLLVMVIVLGLGTLPFVLRRPLLRLRVVEGDERGFVYEIFEVPVTLGAAPGNDLIFEDDEISRNHAVLERRGPSLELVDSNSENGTFVNGDRVSRRRVARGDRIRLGEAVEFEVLR